MTRSHLLAWAALLTGAGYFLVPLVATFEFSLRMRRGTYSLASYASVLSDGRFAETFLFSVVAAIATIVVGTLLVVPTAYQVRLKLPWLRPIVEFLTLLPLVIPAIMLVFGYLRLFNSSSILPMTGAIWSTDLLLVCGYTVLAMPYMYRAVDTGLRTLDVQTLTEAAESLGARRSTVLLRVILPNVCSAVLSGAFLTFAIAIGEFTMASLLDLPAFGPYMQLIGANKAYEPSALAVIAFALTWAAMGLIQLLARDPAARARRA